MPHPGSSPPTPDPAQPDPSAPRIRLLSTATVNRIAAGEVIERPAAATKELVENALDAGATRISVALGGGGIDRLEVTDNGCGMTAAELGLAVLRHCTSKLTDDSLVRITTLGFRGEALPSIGAAARLHITSRPHGADHANGISVEGGVLGAVAPCAGAAGTRVLVRDLFFATPARRKFLKQARTEAEQAEAVVRRLALAAPHVAFRLELDGRVVFETPVQDRLARVAALLGADAAAVLLPVSGERGGPTDGKAADAKATDGGPAHDHTFSDTGATDDDAPQGASRISGYVCSPAVTRASAIGQTLVVNNRPVADPVLRTAVRVAYRDVIAAGRHAVVALYLDLPPDELDVNVHPSKAELRFRDPAAVRALVIGAVRRALGVGTGQVGRDAPAGARAGLVLGAVAVLGTVLGIVRRATLRPRTNRPGTTPPFRGAVAVRRPAGGSAACRHGAAAGPSAGRPGGPGAGYLRHRRGRRRRAGAGRSARRA